MLVENVGILSLRHENIALRNEFERRFDVLSQLIERGFATVNGNVRRVAMQPVQRGVAKTTTTAAGAAMELAPALEMINPPTLMPSRKSLFDLWDEYINGVGGRKPARLFSEPE